MRKIINDFVPQYWSMNEIRESVGLAPINEKTKKTTNCPNCGAVINGAKCEYCGTVFDK